MQYININITPISIPIVNLILALLNPDKDIADDIKDAAIATTIIQINSNKFSAGSFDFDINNIIALILTIDNKNINSSLFNIPPVFSITLV